jgi:hypothetical protein
MKIISCFVLAFALTALTGCDFSSRSLTPVAPTIAPAPPRPAPPVQVITFTDFRTGLTTEDVSDSDNQIVRFNTAGELIWAADGSRFAGYSVRGNLINDQGPMEVQFATGNGERRAYLVMGINYHHYPPPPIIADVAVVDGRLVIEWSAKRLPE